MVWWIRGLLTEVRRIGKNSKPASISTLRRSQKHRLWRTFKRNWLAPVGLAIVMLVGFTAVFADDWLIAMFQKREARPLLAPFDPTEQNMKDRLASPGAHHPMGCDDFGRDILSRIIYGGRVSLAVGTCSILLGLVLGTLLGLVAAYSGGRIETAIMRAMDVLLAFPSLILALLLLSVFGAGISRMILAIGIGFVPQFARLAHSATLAVRENEYVDAARAIGAGRFRIIRLHILPNILGEVIVVSSLWTADAIRYEANLSFLGLGVSPPTPAWGTMIRTGMTYLREAPWLSLYPGLAILVTVVGFNLLGDGLRDVLDPRLQE
jgi:peptide/nickel transport system permease protein